jgi:biotin carboxylase
MVKQWLFIQQSIEMHHMSNLLMKLFDWGIPSNQSYLLGDKIIEVAKSLGVDAIHPGYGF